MYELRHKPSQNVVDFFGTAVLAERYIDELIVTYGEAAVAEYTLSYQGENETEDFVIDGDMLIDTVQQLAIEERKVKWQPRLQSE